MGDEEIAEVPEAAVGNSPQGGVSAKVGKYKIRIAEKQLPYVGMLFSGIVLLIAATSDGKLANYPVYSIVLSSVTMFLSIFGILLTTKQELNDKVGSYNSFFLFLWCFIGACIMTFHPGPFQFTGNGYFGSWAMAIFSMMGVGITADELKKSDPGTGGSMLGLGASSIVVIIASSIAIRDDTLYRNELIYALCVSSITLLFVGGLWFKDRGSEGGKDIMKFSFLAFFALLWIVEACLVTFRGPFLLTGNGYFGSWGGAVCSVFASMAALNE